MIERLKPRHFRTPHQNQVNSDPYNETKSSSIPHVNQVNFDTNTKTKSFSTPTQKPSQIRSPHKKRVSFDPHTKTKLILIQTLKSSHFRPPHQNQVNSDPYNYEYQLVFFLTFPYNSKTPKILRKLIIIPYFIVCYMIYMHDYV